eukprot:TRINITY_DN9189_c0_g1_i1.p1 TRINITY_DN9189_c0_g1~~TRINITY_DN9189_c0_g1_i1.p1  ORF type:complete len:426 (+),score=170.80 TRINITY_DN9189_c0_g1_i1:67-1344(+)
MVVPFCILAALLGLAAPGIAADPMWVVEVQETATEEEHAALVAACSTGGNPAEQMTVEGVRVVLLWAGEDKAAEVRKMPGVGGVTRSGGESADMPAEQLPVYVVFVDPGATVEQYTAMMKVARAASQEPPHETAERTAEGDDVRMILLLNPSAEDVAALGEMKGVEFVEEFDPARFHGDDGMNGEDPAAPLEHVVSIVQMKKTATEADLKKVLDACEKASALPPQQQEVLGRQLVGVVNAAPEAVEQLRNMRGVEKVDYDVKEGDATVAKESPAKQLPSVWAVEMTEGATEAETAAVKAAVDAVAQQSTLNQTEEGAPLVLALGASEEEMKPVKAMPGVAAVKEDRSMEKLFETAVDGMMDGMPADVKEELSKIKDEEEFKNRVQKYMLEQGEKAVQEEARAGKQTGKKRAAGKKGPSKKREEEL